ncbi:hypothetical protein PbB2_00506 [Candidatus Phycosocius bacilliformis]|uniref:Uncharacterized protein n=1 Tax=Candidatus Phycosocius bacilliformis TaxID=1445552 RepID=A0A2P2E726_9PROT|nr:hypothetical protein [Candidatus Phycosocius bacilliformis]GBF56849.1 hypothetical protein PbB2_00506 [Candidatus Phycosocius bacilliformis]
MSELLPASIVGLFQSGRAVDLALAVIGLEFAILAARGGREGLMTRIITLVLALGPGACLMLALRAALTDSGLIWVILFLTLSLPLHLMDLQRRRIS